MLFEVGCDSALIMRFALRTEFHDLEKVYLPSEKDIRRSTLYYTKANTRCD